MFDRVKGSINEIINISEKCPEKYREKCFEVLLSALVKAETSPVGTATATHEIIGQKKTASEVPFFKQYKVSEQEWTSIFDFDGTSYSIIVTNLKEKTKAGGQKRLALLLAVKGLLEGVEPNVSKDGLIEICREHGVFDSTNFALHMKHIRDQLVSKGDGWNLTVPGKTKAAELIKELAQ